MIVDSGALHFVATRTLPSKAKCMLSMRNKRSDENFKIEDEGTDHTQTAS